MLLVVEQTLNGLQFGVMLFLMAAGLTLVLGLLRREVVSGRVPARAQDGLVYAWVNGSIRPADYMRVTGRTKQSASRDLAAAVAAGHLVATGSTRTRRYRLGSRLAGIGPVPIA